MTQELILYTVLFSGSSRCPMVDNFVYYRRLRLCYNINGPIKTDFNVIDSTCQTFGAELIRIDSEEKQQYIVQATCKQN